MYYIYNYVLYIYIYIYIHIHIHIYAYRYIDIYTCCSDDILLQTSCFRSSAVPPLRDFAAEVADGAAVVRSFFKEACIEEADRSSPPPDVGDLIAVFTVDLRVERNAAGTALREKLNNT